MPITCEERINSPRITKGTSSVSIERQFVIQGTANYQDALDALDTTAGDTFTITDGSDSFAYARQEISIEPEAEELWNGTARYGSNDSTGGGTGEVGDSSYSFDTGGGTQHITQTSTWTSYPGASSGSPDFDGAIEYDGQNINGVDIVIPQYQWSETHIKSAATISDAYKEKVASLTGKVNSSTFKGFAAGSVLFLGASGTRTGTEKWSVTYKFAYSPNRSGLSVGSITGIAKQGWQYLWVLWEDTAGTDQILKTPKAVYVHTIYESGNFSDLSL